MLYCVFQGKEIIGRFKSKDRAINYLLDCWFDGIEKVTMRPMTKEKYQEYMKKMLDNESKMCYN